MRSAASVCLSVCPVRALNRWNHCRGACTMGQPGELPVALLIWIAVYTVSRPQDLMDSYSLATTGMSVIRISDEICIL